MKVFPVLKVFISSKNLSFICYARLCVGYFYIKSSPKENFPIKWKRALAECICPKRENARFESGQMLWNSDLHLWFERKNPGPKKPGNGWCAWLFARRIYTVSLIWSECRDSNSRPLEPHSSAIPNFATPGYSVVPQTAHLEYHSFRRFASPILNFFQISSEAFCWQRRRRMVI